MGGVVEYFSIDAAMEQIKNQHTKEIFKEVHSSYAMGNYRSAVVMLWSVVVTDLILKLKELEYFYNDETAKKILNDIEEEQKKDPTSSKWEAKLIESFQKKLNFFESPDLIQLENLQKMRHISAHPVITDENLLYSPKKSSVLALIQFSMESVLIKESLFSANIINHILSDLSRIKSKLVSSKDRANYFENKYLGHMSDYFLLKFIKTLWQFIFVKNNSELTLNIQINVDIFICIINKKRNVFINFLEVEQKVVSAIPSDEQLLDRLMDFLYRYRFFLKYFDIKSKQTIYSLLDNPAYRNYELIKYDNLVNYIDDSIRNSSFNFDLKKLKIIKKLCVDENIIQKYHTLCINYYLESEDAESAVSNFRLVILNNIIEFNLILLRELMEGICRTGYSALKFNSSNNHEVIIDRVFDLDYRFDFKFYSIFHKMNGNYIAEKSAAFKTTVDQNNLPF